VALQAIDHQHFYLDDRLIDLVWIGYHAGRQSNAANHHDIKRNLNWLANLARRLQTGNVDSRDERVARRKLKALGRGWDLAQK